MAFLDLHKNELHHLDPIFMPFPKWCITFLYLKNWQSYWAKCDFQLIFHCILPILLWWVNIATFLASNHQNLTPINEFMPVLVLVHFRTLKNSIFIKSLNFTALGTPQTAFRGAKRRSELQTRFSPKKGVKKFQFFVILIVTWGN